VILKPGLRLFAQNSSCEVIVIKGAGTAGSLSCAGLEMLTAAPGAGAGGSHDGPPVELGKRYTDDGGQLELLCTKAGPGPLAAGGRELSLKAAKPLPASD
jgi:hypothetical protein